jgi:hypothetical protein
MFNRKENLKISERLSGIIALVSGLILICFNVIAPLVKASNRADKIYISHAVVVITPFALVFGLIYTIGGQKVTPILGHPQRLSKWGWVLAIAMFVIGQLVDYQFTKTLRGFGYKI